MQKAAGIKVSFQEFTVNCDFRFVNLKKQLKMFLLKHSALDLPSNPDFKGASRSICRFDENLYLNLCSGLAL